MAKRKELTMSVRVSVPAWMTAAQARREVRTLINQQCNYLTSGPMELGWPEVSVKARQVRPLGRS